MVCGALVPLSGRRIELTALTVQGKTRRDGFHIPAPLHLPAVFLQFKGKSKSAAVVGLGAGCRQSSAGRLGMH